MPEQISQAEEDKIVDLLTNTTMNCLQIAAELRRSASVITMVNKKHLIRDYSKNKNSLATKVTPEKRQQIINLLKENLLTQQEIAKLMDLSDFTIGRINKEEGIRPNRWQPKAKDEAPPLPEDDIVLLFQEGHTLKSISINVKTSVENVRKVLNNRIPEWKVIAAKQYEANRNTLVAKDKKPSVLESKEAKPPTIAGSSANALSPWSSSKSVKSFSI